MAFNEHRPVLQGLRKANFQDKELKGKEIEERLINRTVQLDVINYKEFPYPYHNN